MQNKFVLLQGVFGALVATSESANPQINKKEIKKFMMI